VLKFNLGRATAAHMAFWKMLKIGNDPDRPDPRRLFEASFDGFIESL
jgi:hypothetical protein